MLTLKTFETIVSRRCGLTLLFARFAICSTRWTTVLLANLNCLFSKIIRDPEMKRDLDWNPADFKLYDGFGFDLDTINSA